MLSPTTPPVGSLADLHHWGMLSREATHEAMRQLAHVGGDVLWLRAVPAHLDSGVLVGAPLPLPIRTRRAQLLRWRNYATHLCASYAVRHDLAAELGWERAPLGPEFEALFSTAQARSVTDGTLLSNLLRGRWSILGEVRHEGRQHLFALDRAGQVSDPRELSPEARAVVPMMVAGDSDATIAAALSARASATATVMRRVFGALHVDDRASAIERVDVLSGGEPYAAEHRRADVGGQTLHAISWRCHFDPHARIDGGSTSEGDLAAALSAALR